MNLVEIFELLKTFVHIIYTELPQITLIEKDQKEFFTLEDFIIGEKK